MRLKNGIFFGTTSIWIKIIMPKLALHQGYFKQTIEQALLPEIAIGAWSQGLIIISTQKTLSLIKWGQASIWIIMPIKITPLRMYY